jgi:hypothetical protein
LEGLGEDEEEEDPEVPDAAAVGLVDAAGVLPPAAGVVAEVAGLAAEEAPVEAPVEPVAVPVPVALPLADDWPFPIQLVSEPGLIVNGADCATRPLLSRRVKPTEVP